TGRLDDWTTGRPGDRTTGRWHLCGISVAVCLRLRSCSKLSRPLRLAHCLHNPSPANRGGVIFPMRKEDIYARTMHTRDDPERAELRDALRELSRSLIPLH